MIVSIIDITVLSNTAFLSKELFLSVFSWGKKGEGDNASGPANVSTEMMPSHKFPVLGVYNVELTISDDKNTEDIVVSKKIGVLTKPVDPYYDDDGDPNISGTRKRYVAMINKEKDKINKDDVNIILQVEGRYTGNWDRPFPSAWLNIENFSAERLVMLDWVWSVGGVYNVTLTYKIKELDMKKEFNSGSRWWASH